MSELSASHFLQLVTAGVALFTAMLAALGLTGFALWKIRETDSLAGFTLAAAGLAQALAIVVTTPIIAITAPDLFLPYGGESSPMAWLLLLPAARLAIALSVASVIADGLVVAASQRLLRRRDPAV